MIQVWEFPSVTNIFIGSLLMNITEEPSKLGSAMASGNGYRGGKQDVGNKRTRPPNGHQQRS